jgi:serine/threonine protein kinase
MILLHSYEYADFDWCRYEVVRSLGAGVYGTVLECHDRKHRCSVAIKMCKAHPNFVAAAQEEIKVLKDLRGRCNTPLLLRDFIHDNHICMSFNMLGESLKSVIERYIFHDVPVCTPVCTSDIITQI